MNKQALEAYLEFFTQVAGNDDKPWRRVSESDYSPFDSIVDEDGDPILEIGFSMRTGEPFLRWRGCGLAQLILELPATIPEITKNAIKAEELKTICQELTEALEETVSIIARWPGPNGRWQAEELAEIGRWSEFANKAKEVLEMNKPVRCTWCNKEMEDTEQILHHNTDPFCDQFCLDLQLADDALYAAEEALGDE